MQREVSAGCRCCRRSFRLHLIQDPLHLLSSSLSLALASRRTSLSMLSASLSFAHLVPGISFPGWHPALVLICFSLVTDRTASERARKRRVSECARSESGPTDRPDRRQATPLSLLFLHPTTTTLTTCAARMHAPAREHQRLTAGVSFPAPVACRLSLTPCRGSRRTIFTAADVFVCSTWRSGCSRGIRASQRASCISDDCVLLWFPAPASLPPSLSFPVDTRVKSAHTPIGSRLLVWASRCLRPRE